MPRSKPSGFPKFYWISIILTAFCIGVTKISDKFGEYAGWSTTLTDFYVGKWHTANALVNQSIIVEEQSRICIKVESYEFWPVNVGSRLNSVAHSPLVEESDQHGFDFRFLRAHSSWWWMFWVFSNFASRSYWKHYVLLRATIVFKKFGSLSAIKMSWTSKIKTCFWSSLKLWNVQTFCSSKY